MPRLAFGTRTRKGFTLVELAVVIVIIGVLAAFGVPRFLKSVERSKAAEAFAYLSAVQSAQERYLAQNGSYATDVSQLDFQMPAPTYFSVGTIGPGSTGQQQNSWSLTLTRTGSSAGYGAYTVTFTDQGFDATNSTITSDINPSTTSNSGSSGSSGGSSS
jgi:prepilin-type N-terminal cleavage/methylation domain-containing protein